ncbi:MAG TPA: hypothetical protein VKW08_00305 [Xanthobacteraceae bacterium]|jgi:hypothetical protein|nr:hypothetical protein [Xanthobacteraceae bacterium]
MDTQTAIQILQTLSENLGAQISLLTGEKAAVDLAVIQLQGTLSTESTSDQATISGLQARLDSANTALVAANLPTV